MKYMSSLVSFSLTAITHETVVNSRPDEVTAVRIDGLSLEGDLVSFPAATHLWENDTVVPEGCCSFRTLVLICASMQVARACKSDR